MFILSIIKCWLYKLSKYEYTYGSSIKYNRLIEYTYKDINSIQYDELQDQYEYKYATSIQYEEMQNQYNYDYGDINNG